MPENLIIMLCESDNCALEYIYIPEDKVDHIDTDHGPRCPFCQSYIVFP